MKKQEILLPFTDYFTFFSFLYTDCPRDDSTHISWKCTPDKKILCAHITAKWVELKEMMNLSDDKVTMPFTEFQKHIGYNTQGIIRNKRGEPSKQLTTVKHSVNGKYLLAFIDALLPEITYHQNMLKLYWSSIKPFYQLFAAVHLDINF